jgi:hypothetical protein
MAWVVVLVERGNLSSAPPQVFSDSDGLPWPHRVLAEQARRRIHFDANRGRSQWEPPLYTFVAPIRQEPA